MLHFTIDGFRGFRSRFDDAHLIQEVLEDAPAQLGLKRAMPAFVLPYYNGVVPEDCGISAFVFLAGGHFTPTPSRSVRRTSPIWWRRTSSTRPSSGRYSRRSFRARSPVSGP